VFDGSYKQFVYLVKSPALWDVILCHWASSSWCCRSHGTSKHSEPLIQWQC